MSGVPSPNNWACTHPTRALIATPAAIRSRLRRAFAPPYAPVTCSASGWMQQTIAMSGTAMVCCIQPLALHVTGAYGGANARRSLERIAAGVAISALVGWVQAQLFGEGTPDIPNKTAYLYSGALIASYVWLGRQFAH